jgi:hypothetical protein
MLTPEPCPQPCLFASEQFPAFVDTTSTPPPTRTPSPEHIKELDSPTCVTKGLVVPPALFDDYENLEAGATTLPLPAKDMLPFLLELDDGSRVECPGTEMDEIFDYLDAHVLSLEEEEDLRQEAEAQEVEMRAALRGMELAMHDEQAEMDEIFTYIDARDAAYCLLSEGCCPLTESEARDLRELAQREEAEIRSAIVLLKTQELALAHSCVEVAC